MVWSVWGYVWSVWGYVWLVWGYAWFWVLFWCCQVTGAVLVAPCSVTHSFNSNQRAVGLTVTSQGPSSITVRVSSVGAGDRLCWVISLTLCGSSHTDASFDCFWGRISAHRLICGPLWVQSYFGSPSLAIQICMHYLKSIILLCRSYR